MDTGFFLRESNRREELTTHPYLALRLKREYSCTPTPPLGIHGILSDELHLLHVFKTARAFCLFFAKVEELKTFSHFKTLRGQHNTIAKSGLGNKEHMLEIFLRKQNR